MDIHVVSKLDSSQHAAFQMTKPSLPLAPSSVRVQPTLVSLASNNLTYAGMGDMLHWWDPYPVPATAPVPYNNRSVWGIVPAWGFAKVIASTTVSLPGETTFLWGYWPLSSHVVDLQLIVAEPEGHWMEVSPYRQALLPLYNRYIRVNNNTLTLSTSNNLSTVDCQGWEASMRPVWACGYLLSEYVFTPNPQTHPPVHPTGNFAQEAWTTMEADISEAVVINLSASSKTGRALTYNLCGRPAGTGPLGLLQITSSPSAIAQADLSSLFPVHVVSYTQVSSSAVVQSVEEWLVSRQPKKIVIVDHGGRDGSLLQLHSLIKNNPFLKTCQLMVLAVGLQQKVYKMEDLEAMQKTLIHLHQIQVNTSAMQEAAIATTGPTQYFGELDQRWASWLAGKEAAAPDLRLVWGKGVVGAQGIEGGWESLCQSRVKPDEALVYTIA
ncbi:hypothetical protein ASPZODRAFT_143677 [Penicilliopsis zonata CBS 506.65]|uniref:Uncharacterized protein n=1 Tax=Penicilliopsis zonata CBS 506.65 TaxID=1073090 RepID=A0A1L9SF79_9EURO|nr:hypothetical protein ASPZODRAFT_143677 [Penicilliopsis zonata CBS 506.65]OJJ45798.1 hypothetical protein ASPZODRAFT_143677 [Penicilliopsis zonata CBS 506.65]